MSFDERVVLTRSDAYSQFGCLSSGASKVLVQDALIAILVETFAKDVHLDVRLLCTLDDAEPSVFIVLDGREVALPRDANSIR